MTKDTFSPLPNRSVTLAERLAKRGRVWCSKKFIDLFSATIDEQCAEEALGLLRARKVLDCVVQPGLVSARSYDEAGSAHKVEIVARELTDQQWEEVFTELARGSYFLALMLSGQIPEEMEAAFARAGAELVPVAQSSLEVVFDGAKTVQMNKHIAAVIIRFCDMLDADPFVLFSLRGRGREESMLQLRKHRGLLKSSQTSSLTVAEAGSLAPPHLPIEAECFWSLGTDLSGLSYRIRADELPASVLKWLDPLPLEGLEQEIDQLLEGAYDRVTRLAQGFGLRL